MGREAVDQKVKKYSNFPILGLYPTWDPQESLTRQANVLLLNTTGCCPEFLLNSDATRA